MSTGLYKTGIATNGLNEREMCSMYRLLYEWLWFM